MGHILKATLHLLALVSIFSATGSASNYDEYIGDIMRSNRAMQQSYLSQPGVADHWSKLSDIYDDNGYLLADPIASESGDDEAEREWERLQQRLNDIRMQTRSQLDNHAMIMRADPEWANEDDVASDGEQFGQEVDARPSETAPENNLWGEHKIASAGGAPSPNGVPNKANEAREKTDSLPSYCDPPNPCPKHMPLNEAKAPCHHDVKDTIVFNKDWIQRKTLSGECECDNEHMMNCPKKKSNDGMYQNDGMHNTVKKKAGPYSPL